MMLTEKDLRPYQQRTIAALYEHDRVQAVLPMGAGKTASALKAVCELKDSGEVRRGIVLAPKRVAQLTWPAETAAWDFTDGLRVRFAGTPVQRSDALADPTVDLVVIGIDNAQWLADQLKYTPADDPIFDLLIIDESSRLKNPRSKRARALFKIIRRFSNVWFLTGTPAPNSQLDQFGPLKLLSGGQLWGQNFDKWRTKYFEPLDFNEYRWAIRDEWREKIDSDIASWSYTIGADDMPELPELVVQEHWVDMPVKTRSQYQRMEKELVAILQGADAVTAANAGVKTGKMEQLSQGFVFHNAEIDPDTGEPRHTGEYTRFDRVKHEKVTELVEAAGGEPVLIAYHFAPDLELLRETYGADCPRIGAGVSDANVERYVGAWNRGEVPVMLIHPASAGHGLNLQHGGSQMIWMMPVWSNEYWDQTIKRIHRPGQKRRTFIHVVCSSPGGGHASIDAAKRLRVAEKISQQEALIRMIGGRSE